MSEEFKVTTVEPKFSLDDRSYGKDGIKVLHVTRNGKVRFKRFEVQKLSFLINQGQCTV